MKKITALLIASAFMMIFISSCSDDSSTTPTPTPTNKGNTYFPLTKGSWWTYKIYSLDSNGAIDPTTLLTTKTAYDSTMTKDGHEASVFDILDTTGAKIDVSQYYYATSSQIWWYSNLLPELPYSLPIDIPIAWYKIADSKGTEWTLFTQKLDSASFQFGSFTILLNDTMKIKISYEGIAQVNYGANLDKTVNAQKYKVTYTYGGASIIMGIPLQIPFTVEVYEYFGQNIGLIKEETKPSSVTTILGSYSITNGSNKILLDYHIAK
jgi:hypothetical protein